MTLLQRFVLPLETHAGDDAFDGESTVGEVELIGSVAQRIGSLSAATCIEVT
jgi:hypothetical protein